MSLSLRTVKKVITRLMVISFLIPAGGKLSATAKGGVEQAKK
jgi:hypothetical protein